MNFVRIKWNSIKSQSHQECLIKSSTFVGNYHFAGVIFSRDKKIIRINSNGEIQNSLGDDSNDDKKNASINFPT